MNWWGGGINLFVTEEEKRAYLCGYVGIKAAATENVNTLQEYLDEKQTDMFEEVLDKLYKGGIKIVTLYQKSNGTEYCNRLESELSGQENKLREVFFEVDTDENEVEFIRHIHFGQQFRMGTKYLSDYKSEYYNVENGRRKTFYQPNDKNFNHIYFFGPCLMVGSRVKDEDTIESYLQKMLNKNQIPYVVENCGVWLKTPMSRILATDIKAGDIVICYTRDVYIDNYPSINLWDICEKYQFPETYFAGNLHHCNAVANKAYAEAIYDTIINMEMPPVADTAPVGDLKNDIIKDTYLNRYFTDVFDMLKSNPDMKIGSIVMNANPFTLGHRYLIEQAAGGVDYLIVFVVEEDLSTFSFLERWWLVKKGTEDMANVKIVPSGNFVLSNETFPGYFIKEVTPDIKEQTEYDINLFADAVAKPLGIKYRFVGEELTDEVTRQYNEAMKKILPSKGIEVVEIKRKECAQSVISASAVRRMLENGECEKLADFVPETTRKYIC